MNFEWKILDFFDKFKSDFFNIFNQYVSEIFGIIAIVFILMIIYWCISKEKGKIIAFNTVMIMCLNGILKGMFNRKRPFEHEGKEYLRKLDLKKDGANGSSFPSGHSMNSAALYGSVVYCYHERKHLILDIFMILITALVGISRMYLGVHFFTDVLFGILFGIVFVIIFSRLQNYLGDKVIYLYIISTIALLPFCFFEVFGRSYIKSYGMLFGFVLGSILEDKFVKFDTNTSFLKKLIRVLIGLVLVGGVYLIYNIVPGSIHNNYIFTFLIHFLIAFNGFFLTPLVFKKIEK